MTKPAESLSAFEARFVAQQIAFAPVVFQVARSLCSSGILNLLAQNVENGVAKEEIYASIKLPRYSIKLLLDGGTVNGFILRSGDCFFISKLGYFILNDEMTQVNFNFVNDICYQGLFFLDDALRNEKPEGLKFLGDWDTIYDGIAKLPEETKKSWLKFDHFYSDSAFDSTLPLVFENKPRRLLDVGGNTGRFAQRCLRYDKDVNFAIFDLPGQIGMARNSFYKTDPDSRMSFYEGDVLSQESPLPLGFDAIWMSQFLDCFSPENIVHILKKAAAAMSPETELYILETYCDRQKFDASKYCVVNTSFYFTCIANGNSRMYDATDMISYLEQAGLKVVGDWNEIGFCHTLFRCKRI